MRGFIGQWVSCHRLIALTGTTSAQRRQRVAGVASQYRLRAAARGDHHLGQSDGHFYVIKGSRAGPPPTFILVQKEVSRGNTPPKLRVVGDSGIVFVGRVWHYQG